MPEGPSRAASVFSTPRGIVAPWLGQWFGHVREYRTEEMGARIEPVDFCFREPTREELLRFRELRGHLRHMVRRGGHVVVLYRTHGVEVLAPRDTSFIAGALPVSDVAVVWYRGGRLLSALQKLWDERLAGIRKSRRADAVQFVVTALLAAPLTWLANRAAEHRAKLGELPRDRTRVLMDITVV